MSHMTPDLVAYADQRAARAAEYCEALIDNERRHGYGTRPADAKGVAALTEIITRLFDDERSMAEAMAIAIRRLATR